MFLKTRIKTSPDLLSDFLNSYTFKKICTIVTSDGFTKQLFITKVFVKCLYSHTGKRHVIRIINSAPDYVLFTASPGYDYLIYNEGYICFLLMSDFYYHLHFAPIVHVLHSRLSSNALKIAEYFCSYQAPHNDLPVD